MATSNNVDELISTAARTQEQADLRKVVQALKDHEVFMPFEAVFRDGAEVKAVPLLLLPDGTHAMMTYTSNSHPDLPDSFAGATFDSALKAALRMPELDWVIVTNRTSEWISIHKTQIPAYLDSLNNNTVAASSSDDDRALDTVEELVSRAVGSKSMNSVSAVTAALEDREIFLEMSRLTRDDGRQSMNSFLIEPLGPVVRAYTSRLRPGIRYGGLRWSALKEMIRALPEIKGVQVMNNADDWVVIDRKALGLDEGSEA
ncbi:SseB family protein [Mycobacterium sp. 852002-53434_SCH5985345]|uniref:SseB family protein n=1 Tax=Mycobacterium sp. 852002-53434_SCH5985345 TaxID=1834107 RepID=UPI000A8F576B|nr:SseB family protein [Mycobacterium sp. 852002-53434_SCH5985345]